MGMVRGAALHCRGEGSDPSWREPHSRAVRAVRGRHCLLLVLWAVAGGCVPLRMHTA